MNAVRAVFRTADGSRGFQVDPDECPGHVEDFDSYRYPSRRAGHVPDRQLPLKDGVHDHGADEFRYVVCNEFPALVYGVMNGRAKKQRVDDQEHDTNRRSRLGPGTIAGDVLTKEW